MTQLVGIEVVARALNLSPLYVRDVVADKFRAPERRRFPVTTHERIPPMAKDGRRWVITRQSLDAHMTRIVRSIEPRV